jgi:hypothetical protein
VNISKLKTLNKFQSVEVSFLNKLFGCSSSVNCSLFPLQHTVQFQFNPHDHRLLEDICVNKFFIAVTYPRQKQGFILSHGLGGFSPWSDGSIVSGLW